MVDPVASILRTVSDNTLLRVERAVRAEMLDRERREVLTDALNRFIGLMEDTTLPLTRHDSLTEHEVTRA